MTPQFKQVALEANIIFFTAHEELRAAAETEPGIDAFLLKASASHLIPVVQWIPSVEAMFG